MRVSYVGATQLLVSRGKFSGASSRSVKNFPGFRRRAKTLVFSRKFERTIKHASVAQW